MLSIHCLGATSVLFLQVSAVFLLVLQNCSFHAGNKYMISITGGFCKTIKEKTKELFDKLNKKNRFSVKLHSERRKKNSKKFSCSKYGKGNFISKCGP